jgi:hypothetical protein
MKTRLTTLRGKGAKPVPLTIWPVRCEGRQIICQPHVVTGPVRLFQVSGSELPPEWLERLIALPNDPEDLPCR